MIKSAVAKLLPREDKFYRLIRSLSAQARLSATHFKIYVESTDEQARKQALMGVQECRAVSKKLSAEVTEQLCLTFITPYDREDIQDFTHSLYKIIKTTKKICDRMEIYKLTNERGDFARQSAVIMQEAEAMEEMVLELTNGHDNQRIISKVNILRDLEQKGDTVLSELLGTLFREENDMKELILRKDIYDMLEKVIDRYRDTAAIALQIVLKHS
jgi:uncharacterized protein Yka (UPF0111/DUF47 family)